MFNFEKDFAKNPVFDNCDRKILEQELNSFIRIPRSLLTNKEITLNGIILYSRLRAYNNTTKTDKWINKSVSYLVAQTGIGKGHFKEELDKLKNLELIEVRENTDWTLEKYSIRIIKDLLPPDDLSFIKMNCRLFWYPQLNNRMRLLYAYIVTQKDFKFNQKIQLEIKNLALKTSLNKNTVRTLLKKLEELEIIKIEQTQNFKGITLVVLKDFSKSSELEDNWINEHCSDNKESSENTVIKESDSVNDVSETDDSDNKNNDINYINNLDNVTVNNSIAPTGIGTGYRINFSGNKDETPFNDNEGKNEVTAFKQTQTEYTQEEILALGEKIQKEMQNFKKEVETFGRRGITKNTKKKFDLNSMVIFKAEQQNWQSSHLNFNKIQLQHSFLINYKEDYIYADIPVEVLILKTS